MDISEIFNESFQSLIIFFPVMKLDSVYQLHSGKFGPLSTLKTEFPALAELGPLFLKNSVNDEPLENPVVAVSVSNPEKLIQEIEFITFFAASSETAKAEEEVLGQRHIIGLFQKDDKTYFNLDGYAAGAPLHLLHETKFQYFPRSYFTWDDTTIQNFETFLSDILGSPFYNALISCLSEVHDKEAKRDRARILVAVKIFNEAMIPPNVPSLQMFSKTYIILLGAAFEALLNLPQDNIEKAFQHSVMLLAGNRSTTLKRWCKEFYSYRSRLAHGDIDWYRKEESFNIVGNKSLAYPYIASRLFVHCLKTKLFLMGLFPEYTRDNFLLEAYE
jgi:hypothetical protein